MIQVIQRHETNGFTFSRSAGPLGSLIWMSKQLGPWRVKSCFLWKSSPLYVSFVSSKIWSSSATELIFYKNTEHILKFPFRCDNLGIIHEQKQEPSMVLNHEQAHINVTSESSKICHQCAFITVFQYVFKKEFYTDKVKIMLNPTQIIPCHLQTNQYTYLSDSVFFSLSLCRLYFLKTGQQSLLIETKKLSSSNRAQFV